MSVTISLKQPNSSRDGSAFGIIQLCLALAALLTIFGLADVFSAHTPERQVQSPEAAAAAREVDRLAALSKQPESPETSPAAPHPKHLKIPFSGLTTKEGVFSL